MKPSAAVDVLRFLGHVFYTRSASCGTITNRMCFCASKGTFEVLLLWWYVLSALSQFNGNCNFIISLLDADSLTCKIITISLTNQFDSRPSASLSQIQPVFLILYVLHLITQDLVDKLCNCESTYLDRVDDVRDEIINNWHRNFGSRLSPLVDRGEHPLSRATARHTKNYVGYHNY